MHPSELREGCIISCTTSVTNPNGRSTWYGYCVEFKLTWGQEHTSQFGKFLWFRELADARAVGKVLKDLPEIKKLHTAGSMDFMLKNCVVVEYLKENPLEELLWD